MQLPRLLYTSFCTVKYFFCKKKYLTYLDEPKKMGTFPPYAPYDMTPMPPTLEGTIGAGREIRIKSKPRHPKPAIQVPRPARPGLVYLYSIVFTEQF